MTGSHEESPAAAPTGFPADMPSMEELREERLRLLKEIRHHKDEQDSIALDIENQPGAADVYRTAARVHIAETFGQRATEYVEDLLPDEITRVITADEINTEKSLAVFIKELQRKRDHVLKKISAIQDRFDKRSDPAQWYVEAVESKYEAKDANDKKVVSHTLENEEEIEKLEKEVADLRIKKSAASAELIKAQRVANKDETVLNNRIKSVKLQNTVHARQCREMNVAHSHRVSGLQVSMNLINTEHYGPGGAPTSQELSQKVKEGINEADDDYFMIQPKDVTAEDIEKVQQKKGKKGKKDKKDKKEKD